MRRVFITESQYRRILESYGQNDGVEFGEPVAIAAQQVRFPVSIDGVEYSTMQINFIIEPHILQGVELYQPHIFIAPELQQKGFGYRIYRRFVHEYGNLYSSEWSKTNKTGAIDKIYQRLGQEPDITVIHDEDANGKYLIAYLSDTEPVNEDVSETMSGIDNRMIPLARHIYQNAIKALETNTTPEPISAEEVNNCQNYFKINNPLYIELTNLGQNVYAAMFYNDMADSHIIKINPKYLFIERIEIIYILHELTHMVNRIQSNNGRVMWKAKSSRKDELGAFMNTFGYLFSKTELQARLSQYYHYCSTVQVIAPTEYADLAFAEIDKILFDIQNNFDYAYGAYRIWRRPYSTTSNVISFSDFKEKQHYNDSPFNRFVKKMRSLVIAYKAKAEKIYKYFSKQQKL